MSDETPLINGRAEPSGRDLYPDELQSRSWWVNWVRAHPYRDGEIDSDAKPTKQPVAPYDEGHARPVRWHSGLDDDEHPSTEFEAVTGWDGLRCGVDIETADRVVSDELGVGIIIPVNGGDSQPVTLIDWDDVRDPDTGELHPVCAEALQEYDGFAEISQSGEGVHQFVLGEIPGGLSKFLRHIDDEPFVDKDGDLPMVEMYCSGRLTAMTGRHVAGCGEDVVEDQQLIDDLCWEFGTADNNSPGTPTDPFGRRADAESAETPSHSEVAEALREAAEYDGNHPDEWTVPDEWSLKYAAVVRARERGDEFASVANWELNGYAGAVGYHDGLELDEIVETLSVRVDDDSLRREVRQAYRKAEAGNYKPPSLATLVNRGMLPEEFDTDPGLDVVNDDVDHLPAETDGGAAAADTTDTAGPMSFEERIRSILNRVNDDQIEAKTARHRIAKTFVDEYDFVYPEEDVNSWRSILWVYDPDEGVYEPRGEYFVERELERVAGDYVTNQVRNEIVGKIERMSIARDGDFEPAPERLVVGNGILDLHTGELDNYTPYEYHRTKIDINWTPDAGEPEAIDEWFHDIVDDSDVDTLYRLIAHTLYKDYEIAEKAAILIGSGNNGKSMFLDLVEQFIGSWNVAHRELQDFSDDGFAANNLQGKLANLATEIGEQEIDDTTTFKKLTGRDMIDAPVKFEKPVRFRNFATLMFATNEMPTFGQDNHAIWRRWVFLNFPYTFDASNPDAKDPEPERQIRRRITREEEFEALLVRCQQEIQRWFEGDRLFADAMDPETVRDKMKKAAEPMYAFATTCLDATGDEDDYVEKSVVRAAYRAYAEEEDLPRMSENEFGERLMALRDIGVESAQKRIDGQRVHVYKNVSLSSRGRQVLGIDEPDDDQAGVDDGYDQAAPKVLERLREMVETNDGEPVSRDALIWSVPDVGKSTADQALDELLDQNQAIEFDDGLMPQ